MLTQAQKDGLLATATALHAAVNALAVGDDEGPSQAEIDATNEQLDLLRGNVGIVQAIAADTTMTADLRLQRILETLGAQEP